MPTTVGEGFAGEVCTQTSFPMVITDPAEIDWEARHHRSGEPNELVANEVQIELDLHLTSTNFAPERTSGE
jgi:hypothetical protein